MHTPVGVPNPAHTPSAERGGWAELPVSPLSPRHGAAGAWVQQRFVLVGGWANPPCPPSTSCLRPAKPALQDGASYDPATGTWQPIADAPVPVSGGDLLVLDDQLYLLAGDSNRSDSPISFLRYDPGTDAWIALPTPDRREWSDLIATDRAIVSMYSPHEKGPKIDHVFDHGAGPGRSCPAIHWPPVPAGARPGSGIDCCSPRPTAGPKANRRKTGCTSRPWTKA